MLFIADRVETPAVVDGRPDAFPELFSLSVGLFGASSPAGAMISPLSVRG
jgi:hypothetical protein